MKRGFISYAVWWIRQSILQALAEQSRIVRLPLNKIGSINKINKMYALLEQSNERPPSAEEIAKELDMTVNDVKESMKTLVVTYQWMRLLLRRRF
jgi:RNA polymerase primary sigma factor